MLVNKLRFTINTLIENNKKVQSLQSKAQETAQISTQTPHYTDLNKKKN